MFSRLRETSGVARTVALGLTSLALGTTLFAGPVQTASADPAVTIAEAKAQIEQLQVDAEALNQDYLAIQQQVNASKAEIAQKQSDAQLQAQKVDALRKQVGQAALAQFQDRNVDTAAQLFLNSDTEGFLSQVSTIEKVGANQNTVLQDYQQQRASLADLQKSRQTELAALEEKEADLASLKERSDKKLTDAKSVLDKLTAQQQQALADQAKRESQDAKTVAESALGTTPDPSDDPADASSKGLTAIAWAKKQLGKPYVFGATGPNSFDCSGLTLGAWKAAGVSLNRTSQAQFRNGQAVSKSDLQPGDLVFFYSGLSHVALYVGDGTIIHAPHPGVGVRYAKLDSMPFAGARRPA
ncbi:Cell wall-associated hydrolase, NlpC family [Microlunatus sagamiharensis]|uniref:Cell wall-associated hydrolase, NlpC family n=1 Tax=Microlunatus sagamiharensis TaxID=546874 RepID=A0A1H2MRD4_9ACTN|nr:C40 family peptidase [Microlunatus sagamiharensis]SDU95558.1 Cell wall-associated hydrolase, NlpC family [Microlunatus sagamiharensis]